jgi:hypothetical protein
VRGGFPNGGRVCQRTWQRRAARSFIEATNSPFGWGDAVRASWIGGRIILAGIPDGDAYALPALGCAQANFD